MLDWDSGYRGPPLLHFILLQSLSAPFKPLVAHFLYFGPVLPLAIASVLRWSIAAPNSRREPHMGLAVVILAFLPFLLIGSESRQWVAVFPVCVAWLTVRLRSEWRLLPFAIMGLVLLVPAAFLKPTLTQAVIAQLPFTGPDWQAYFGRQGPWMSREYYFNGIVAFGSFVLVLLAMNISLRISSFVHRDS
jgi:hypothetical protein